MIQVKKQNSDIPESYSQLIERYRLRKVDFDAGHNSKPKPSGHDLFKKIKKKKVEYDALKSKLSDDQGYICCYCNARIELKGSSVEHITPISIDKSLLAEYDNLLIACNGGRQERFENNNNQEQYPLYCDAHRENNNLPFTPLDTDCWSAFQYLIEDGSVIANNPQSQTVIEVLNLDCNILRTSRLEALSILFDDEGQILTTEELEQIWDSFWERDVNGKHEPYFFAIVQNIYELV